MSYYNGKYSGIRWAWNLINRYLRSAADDDNDNELVVNDDMVWEIFRRLPIKSLMRFNNVSKHWNSIIRNPSFAKSYLSPSRGLLIAHFGRNHRHFIQECPKRLFFSNLNDMSNNIVQAYHQFSFQYYFGCDDEYYVTNMVKGLYGLYSYSSFVLCNIATHQLLEFPNISEVAYYYLGFEPVKEVYKVLRFVGRRWDRGGLDICSGIQICTLGGGGGGGVDWRSLDIMPYLLADHPFMPMPSICINGILYFLCKRNFQDSLVALDLSTETFSFIMDILPHAPFSWFTKSRLVEFGGSPNPAIITHAYEVDDPSDDTQPVMVIVSTTKKDDNTWTTQGQNVDLMGRTDLAYAGTLPTGEILLAPMRANDNPLPIYRYDHIQNKLLNWIQVHGYVPYFRVDEGDDVQISYHEDSIESFFRC